MKKITNESLDDLIIESTYWFNLLDTDANLEISCELGTCQGCGRYGEYGLNCINGEECGQYI